MGIGLALRTGTRHAQPMRYDGRMTFLGSPWFGVPLLGLGALLVLAVLIFGFPALLMWLWNTTMPDLFGWSRLRYWQAFRLELIAALLFGASRFR